MCASMCPSHLPTISCQSPHLPSCPATSFSGSNSVMEWEPCWVWGALSCPIHLFRRVLGQGRVDAVVLPPVYTLSPRLRLWTPHPFVSVQMHLTSVGLGSDPRTSPRVADRSTLDVATCRRGRCNARPSPRSPTASSRILPSVTCGQTLAGLDERCACAIPEGSCVELEPRKGLGTSAR